MGRENVLEFFPDEPVEREKKKERDKKEKKKNIWVEGGDGMANERFQSRVPSPSSFSLSLWAPKKPRKINE